MGSSTSNVRIEDCNIINTKTHAIGITGGISDRDNSLINNKIFYAGSYGIQLWGAYPTWIEGNNIIATNESGIYIIGNFNNPENITLLNNNITVYNGWLAIEDGTADSDINRFVYNNSFGEIKWTGNSTGGFLGDLSLNGSLTYPGTVRIEENLVSVDVSGFSSGFINSTILLADHVRPYYKKSTKTKHNDSANPPPQQPTSASFFGRLLDFWNWSGHGRRFRNSSHG
jgi:hypothetical protein